MEIMYSAKEYIDKLFDIYNNYKTYYAWGAFGAPANKKNRERYKVPDDLSTDTFLFDCSGFAYKAIPWGWCGDKTRTYGGATYNAIPTDTNFNKLCIDKTDDFTKIQAGECLYMEGHVGIYIGDGKVLECTAAWDNCVMMTECKNVGIDTGLKHKRTWLMHGKLPFILYKEETHTIKAEYTTARIGEGLIRIARRCGITFDEIKKLNPDIKGPVYLVRFGQKVRVK